MEYFLRISAKYVAKNKLQEAVAAMIEKEFCHRLFDSREAFELGCRELQYNVVKLNREYPRCSALEVSWYLENKTEILGSVGNLKIEVYPVLIGAKLSPDEESLLEGYRHIQYTHAGWESEQEIIPVQMNLAGKPYQASVKLQFDEDEFGKIWRNK